MPASPCPLAAAGVLRRTVTNAVACLWPLGFFGCTSVVSGLVDTNPDNAPATAASQVHQLSRASWDSSP